MPPACCPAEDRSCVARPACSRLSLGFRRKGDAPDRTFRVVVPALGGPGPTAGASLVAPSAQLPDSSILHLLGRSAMGAERRGRLRPRKTLEGRPPAGPGSRRPRPDPPRDVRPDRVAADAAGGGRVRGGFQRSTASGL